MNQPPQDNIVQQVGYSTDARTTYDIWASGAVYLWADAAAATTVVSSDGDDGPVGDGARTVAVYGLDADLLPVREVVALNGATPVTMTAQLRRVNRVEVLTAGSAGLNQGTIDVITAAAIRARIGVELNRTLQGYYTIPANRHGFLRGWNFQTDASAAATAALQVRPLDGAWQTIDVVTVEDVVNASQVVPWHNPLRFEPGTDIRVCMLVGNTSLIAVSRYEIELSPKRF